MESIRHRKDCAERGTGYIMHTEDGDELSVRTYLSTDGNLYAAVIYDEAAGRDGMRTWDVGCFFTFPEHNTLSYSDSGGYAVSMDSFSDLFGHDGPVSYTHLHRSWRCGSSSSPPPPRTAWQSPPASHTGPWSG